MSFSGRAICLTLNPGHRRDMVSAMQFEPSGERLLEFSDLQPGTFRRYWRFFFWFNVLGTAAESFAALGFFVLLQQRIGPGDPFSEEQVGRISLWTLPLFFVFFIAFFHLANRMVEGSVLPLLPRECFVENAPWPSRESPERQIYDCMSLLGRLADYQRGAALAVAIVYGVWGAAVYFSFQGQVDEWFLVWVGGVGSLVAFLFYLRLQGFDPVPLVLEPHEKENRSTLAIQQLISERNRKRARDSDRGLRHYIIAAIQMFLSWVFRVWRHVKVEQSPQRRKKEDRLDEVKRLIDIEHLSIHQIQFILRFALLATLIVYGVRNVPVGVAGSEAVSWFHDRTLVSVYVMISVLAALGMDTYRFVMRLIPKDGEDDIHRLCSESFGVITESTSRAEREAFLGLYDEKTGLYRHWWFERRLLERFFDRTTSSADSARFSVVLVDVDNFKLVNTVFNYVAADILLSYVAKSMLEVVRKEELARYGGEEFVAYIPDLRAKDVCRRAEKIRSHVLDTITVERVKGRLIIKRRGSRSRDEHLITHEPDAKALEEVKAILETPEKIAWENREPLQRLLDSEDGVVWQLTVSVGVVVGRRPDANEGSGDARRPPGRRDVLGQVREEYNRFVEDAGKCNADAKKNGRNGVYFKYEGDERSRRFSNEPGSSDSALRRGDR